MVLMLAACGLTKRSSSSSSTSTSTAAQTLDWKGHTWKLTNGGMAGVADGSGNNVFVDSNGYLHLKISKSGSTWTAAELFTSDKMGFGTYQWQIEGAVDNMDKTTVLGLFPYGPSASIGHDGENEIDIEFSRWNIAAGLNASFTCWPSTGNGSTGANGSATHSDTDSFALDLSGQTLSTARMVWSSTSVVSTILDSSDNILHSHTYAPSDPTTHIPQEAVPLGINFWSFQETPTTEQEIVIRNFEYVP